MTDAIVIGAGLSGLVAARRLVRAGRKIIVVEARDRVGGRTLSTEFGGQIVDLGGQWIGDKHRRMSALADELGIATFAQHGRGKKVLDRGGKRSTYSGLFPRIGLLPLGELAWKTFQLERLARSVPKREPLAAPRAGALDAQSVADWLARNVRSRAAREMLELATQMIYTVEPHELSMLYFLLYAHSGEGFQRLARIERGAQERRLATGAQSVSERLADEIGREHVRLEHPVRAIEQDGTHATVHTSRGSFQTTHVIAALPPALLAKIDFTPAVTAARARLHTSMPAGSAIKCLVSYARPFWRDRGFSGEALSTTATVRATFDDCSESGDHAALVAFVVGDRARELSRETSEARRATVIRELVHLFGPEAAKPTGYVDKDWLADEWSIGCYVGVMAPNVLSATAAALRAPHGRVHFAGTETAVEHLGYFEGAIEAGERAAGEVLER